jgi:hypothetical protein
LSVWHDNQNVLYDIEELQLDTTNTLASAEASRANMPPGCKIILALRDYSLIEILLPNLPLAQRVGIVFDPDRDIRILSVLAALVIIDRGACAGLIGLAETQGRITSFWCGPPPVLTAGQHQRLLKDALQHAATAALWPDDEWAVEPPTFVQVAPNGNTVDRAALATDSPLLVIPERYALGRVKL